MSPVEDFAAILGEARAGKGLTQAQLALAAGLTASYVSFLENRKKPPPSDDVCERLARVLEIPARRLLEVAHMERAPTTVRRRLQSLASTLRRERRSRRRALESLLSPFLLQGPPGYLEGALDTLSTIPARRRRRIREVLDAIGRRNVDREGEISRIVDGLPEEERTALLEALPRLLGRAGRAAPEGVSAPAAPPVRPTVEPLFYAPPDPAKARGRYVLEVTVGMARASDALRPGDLIVVDPMLPPKAGDLVVLRSEAGTLLRAAPPDGRELEGQAGTVVEMRRRLRR
jgi:transcriptional regulator with XRE-family HTH domain